MQLAYLIFTKHQSDKDIRFFSVPGKDLYWNHYS